MTRVFIVRHGATRMNDAGGVSVDRERGWSDVPLTKEGRQEGQRAGIKLRGKGIEAIVASDLARSHETAVIIGNLVGVKPQFSHELRPDRKSTRLNSSHSSISYAVFCLKKK